MAVKYKLCPLDPFDVFGHVIVAPDLAWNAKNGISSDWDCAVCNKGIGISWKQGVSPELVAECPNCGAHNKFVRVET